MKGLIIFLIIGAFITGIYFLIKEFNKKENLKVIKSSKKLAALQDLNNRTSFRKLQRNIQIIRKYDNKSHYNRIQESYLLSSIVRENIVFYTQYLEYLQENRIKNIEYHKELEQIKKIKSDVNYSELNISERSYLEREERLFKKNTIDAVVEGTVEIVMSYSSPKGRVNLLKSKKFSSNDLKVCVESIATNKLDRYTYKQLALVERGKVSDSLRYDILRRDNFKCVICGASQHQGARLHVDHIVPIAKGGKSTPDNLRTLCERCNIGKSDKLEVLDTHEDNKATGTNSTCKLCGAKLVLKKGKYGDFYGCSNYPECRYTEKLTQHK